MARLNGRGRIKLGERRMYTLSYADDMVLLVEDEDEMRSMIKRLESYLERQGLLLNAEKTKIFRCRRGGGETWKEGLEVEKEEIRGGESI